MLQLFQDNIHRGLSHDFQIDLHRGNGGHAHIRYHVVVIAHHGNILRHPVPGLLQGRNDPESGFIAVADKCGGHVRRECQVGNQRAVGLPVRQGPVLPVGYPVLHQRLDVAHKPVMDTAGFGNIAHKADAPVSLADEIIRQQIAAVIAVGYNAVHMVMLVIKIQEYHRQPHPENHIQIVVADLPQHNQRIDLMTDDQLRGQTVVLLPHGYAFAQYIGAALEHPGHPLGKLPVKGSLIAAEALRRQNPYRKKTAGRPLGPLRLLLGAAGYGGTIAHLHCLSLDCCTKLRTDAAPVPQSIGNRYNADRKFPGNVRHFHAVFHGISSCLPPLKQHDVYYYILYHIRTKQNLDIL